MKTEKMWCNKMNTDAKKILKIVSLSVFLIFIVTYTFFRSKDLIFGVRITGLNVTDGMKVADKIMKITGNARNAVSLTFDDRIISIDQKGNFNETIALLPGYNIISIKAKDEFGNSDQKDYKLMY